MTERAMHHEGRSVADARHLNLVATYAVRPYVGHTVDDQLENSANSESLCCNALSLRFRTLHRGRHEAQFKRSFLFFDAQSRK